jgi:hypothetical protein
VVEARLKVTQNEEWKDKEKNYGEEKEEKKESRRKKEERGEE